MAFNSFPSIEQYRNVIREVSSHAAFKGKDEQGNPIYDYLVPKPTIKFHGTVKIHGRNSAIVLTPEGEIQTQSRTRMLSDTDDNAGFKEYIDSLPKEELLALFEPIPNHGSDRVVYGEWAGQGIQGGAAIGKVPKLFIMFAAKTADEWVDIGQIPELPEQRIFNIKFFQTFSIEIDFNNPQSYINQLVEFTQQVEQQCPVAKHFGVLGVGEGVVWTSADHRYQFKVKGDEHSNSKVKKLVAVDPEKLESITKFVDYSVTTNRLKQGIEILKERNLELTEKSTGDFLAWMVADVLREERDVIVASRLTDKDVKNAVAMKARNWYLTEISEGTQLFMRKNR